MHTRHCVRLPVSNVADHRQREVSRSGASIVLYLIEKLGHVTASDGEELASVPSGQEILVEIAPYLGGAAKALGST